MPQPDIGHYTWFIHSGHTQVNEACATELGAESACREILCSDGKKRNLWMCTKEFVDEMTRSKQNFFGLFEVYRKYRDNPPRRVPIRISPEGRRALGKLSQIQKERGRKGPKLRSRKAG